MNHYVYLLQSKVEEKYYIGVRSCECPIAEDSYMGSSRVMTAEDKANCWKIILKKFDNRKDAVAYEVEMHNRFNVATNNLFWNKAKQTSTGFDTSGVAMGKLRDYSVSDETKAKISSSLTGYKHDKAFSEKLSKRMKGFTVSNAHKAAISKAQTGRKRTEAEKKAHSDKMKGKFLNGNHPQARRVQCIETGVIFATTKEAAEYYKLKSHSSITNALRGYAKTAGGYTWQYMN